MLKHIGVTTITTVTGTTAIGTMVIGMGDTGIPGIGILVRLLWLPRTDGHSRHSLRDRERWSTRTISSVLRDYPRY